MFEPPNWLQEAKDRADKATKGPWYPCRCGYTLESDATGADLLYEDCDGDSGAFVKAEDAVFCAHARTDVPKLIELVTEMAGLLERLMPEECYGGEVEDAAQCATCQLRDNCERCEVLRVLAKWRGEVPEGD